MKLASAVAEAFGLGAAGGALSPAAVGWGGYNTVSRLVTGTGVWAVKRHGWQAPAAAQASATFAIELAAHAGHVPMARPVPTIGGECWAEIDGHFYRCHEWIHGDAKDNESTSALDAQHMGAIVARLHLLRIPCSSEAATATQSTSRERWESLAAAGRARAAPWAEKLSNAVSAVAALAGEPGPLARGQGELVGSHGDLNAHNVLFAGDGLRLIDWDGAGPAWPRWERANYPLLWAQRGSGRYDREAVLGFLRGYIGGGGTVDDDDPSALTCAASALAPWVAQNLEMALDRPTAEQDVLAGLLVGALLAMPRTIAPRQRLLSECIAML